MKKIIIAACRTNPVLSKSNAALKSALEDNGFRVTVLNWNEADTNEFLDSDIVLLRQTWDYQDDPGGFAAWATRLSSKNCNVQNLPDLAVWNNDKRTIVEYAEAGVNIPASCDTALFKLDECFEYLGSKKIVLKPAFGGSGVGVRICEENNYVKELTALKKEVPSRPIIAQEYLPEILNGEWKLTCIDGNVSFAVHLLPKSGEFRVNSQFDPTIHIAEPPKSAVTAATSIMKWIDHPILSCRVDGVLRNNDFICTEVELTDPDLHLHLSAKGLMEYTRAIKNYIN